MKDSVHISEPLKQAFNEITIKRNSEKMEYLAKHHGNRYYEMLGNLVLENYSIQDAIDKCYEYFTR